MSTYRIVESTPDFLRIEITHQGVPHDVWFRSSKPVLTPNPDAFLPILLLPAMMAEEQIELPEPISPRLLDASVNAQQAYAIWMKKPHTEICAKRGGPRLQNSEGKVGCFFTGGVDSFYTAIKNLDEIDTLIYIHGFDISLSYAEARKSRSENISQIAKELGKEFLEIETNLRESFSKNKVSWSYYHGAALASIALLLTPYLKKCFLAASHSYAGFRPWGSHPMLDPLWSTEALEYVHDGVEFVRVGKLQLIKHNPTAMRQLHVCAIRDETKNCCKCEKCVRTMMTLRVVGGLENCTAFSQPLSLRYVKWFEITGRETGYAELLHQAQLVGDKEIERIVEAMLSKRYQRGWRAMAGKILREIRRLRGQPMSPINSPQ